MSSFISSLLTTIFFFFFLFLSDINARPLYTNHRVLETRYFSLVKPVVVDDDIRVKFVQEERAKNGCELLESNADIAHQHHHATSSIITPLIKPENSIDSSLQKKKKIKNNGKLGETNSGSEINVESSSSADHMGLLKGRQLEGSKGGGHHGKVPQDPSESNEGITETDYQPPRQKTPIHN